MGNVQYPTFQIFTPDGLTPTFTLSGTPASGSLMIIWNGLVQQEGDDFTLAGNDFTMDVIPAASDHLEAYFTVAGAFPPPTGAPGGIRFDPELVALALFIQLGRADFTFESMDRKGLVWTNVVPAAQPYLALIERGGSGVQNRAIGLEKWTLHFLVLVYIRADANPNAIPATTINAAFKAIANVMNSSPIGERQTLGGIVNNAWIDGEVLIDTGILDQQCALVIPISCECGI